MFGTYRTLLALMVVAQHLGGVKLLGSYAVFSFYILSGYLMTYVMNTNYGYTFTGIKIYALKRFLRLYPMYWVATFVSLILILIVGEVFSINYHNSLYLPKDISEIVKNIIMFFPQRESPRLTPPVWALTVMIFYYILIGLGISKSKKIVLSWLVISSIYHVIAFLMDFGYERRYYTILAASLPYATGAFFYFNKPAILRLFKLIKGKVEGFFPLILLSIILVNWLVGHLAGKSRGIFFYINIILCAFMTVILAERNSLPLLTKRLDSWIGNLSYPIFLIHYQIGLVVVYLLHNLGYDLKRPDLRILLFSAPFIILTSWILERLINRPVSQIRARITLVNHLNN